MNSAVSLTRLQDVADLNPSLDRIPADEEAVSFLPMSAVDAGVVDAVNTETRPFNEVRKGYTPFIADDVLVAKITPCFENGKIAQAKPTRRVGFGSTEFHVIRTHADALDARFLVHFLRQERIRREGERKMTGSAGQRRVPEHFLADIQIPLPSLREQRRIAEVLDRTEELRAKRRAALAELERLAESIFLDLFGDPVTNPRRWTDPTLGALVHSLQYGPRFYNEAYSDEGIRIVRISDLAESGTLDFSTMPKLLVSEADRAKFSLRPGDLIFARSGATVGKIALIGPNDPPCIAGAYFIVMRFVDGLDPCYARAVLCAPSVQRVITSRSRQAAQQNFSGPGLRQLPMPLPPIGLQREFSRRVAAVEKLKAAQRASLAELDALFASLQHRAFRGEL